MLVSTKGRYALRVMTALAQQEPSYFVPLNTVAEDQGISEKYLESIISVLSKAGLVEGARGKGGGYRLKRRPEEYTVGEILRLTEGSLAPVACLDREKGGKCERSDGCRTLPMWEKLDTIIGDYLNSVTIADLMKNENRGECKE